MKLLRMYSTKVRENTENQKPRCGTQETGNATKYRTEGRPQVTGKGRCRRVGLQQSNKAHWSRKTEDSGRQSTRKKKGGRNLYVWQVWTCGTLREVSQSHWRMWEDVEDILPYRKIYEAIDSSRKIGRVMSGWKFDEKLLFISYYLPQPRTIFM